ncbi:MAG TPA: metalloregulator ArsR/SmtB family transcription factor [Fimbriimonadaceae bacterium]|jgi:DNA-binding transcriptional ArsR family regulator
MATLALEQLVALADPSRQQIFLLLVEGPCSVGELADQMTVTRPAVSQHLKVLSSAGLVTHEAKGTRSIYCVDPKGIENLRNQLDGLWQRALDSFKSEAERLYMETKSK